MFGSDPLQKLILNATVTGLQAIERRKKEIIQSVFATRNVHASSNKVPIYRRKR